MEADGEKEHGAEPFSALLKLPWLGTAEDVGAAPRSCARPQVLCQQVIGLGSRVPGAEGRGFSALCFFAETAWRRKSSRESHRKAEYLFSRLGNRVSLEHLGVSGCLVGE